MIIMKNKDKDITQSMGDKWEFNEEVTGCFEEMLSRSIPNYHHLRELITNIGEYHINHTGLTGTDILDIGSSHGEQIKLLSDRLPLNRFWGVELSEPMFNHSVKRFEHNPNVTFCKEDITKSPLPVKDCGLITSILTLQFIPIEYRQKVMNNIYQSLHNDGLFIFVEKIIGNNYNYSELYETLYYNIKEKNGYTIDEIRDKKLKLEGVLVPCTNQFNMDLLKQANFSKVDIFWKDLNFIGYLAMK